MDEKIYVLYKFMNILRCHLSIMFAQLEDAYLVSNAQDCTYESQCQNTVDIWSSFESRWIPLYGVAPRSYDPVNALR